MKITEEQFFKFKAGFSLSVAKCQSPEELAVLLRDIADKLSKMLGDDE